MDDIVYKGMRIVMPSILRKDMLHKVHEGNMGIEKCRRHARESLYWPNLNTDVGFDGQALRSMPKAPNFTVCRATTAT